MTQPIRGMRFHEERRQALRASRRIRRSFSRLPGLRRPSTIGAVLIMTYGVLSMESYVFKISETGARLGHVLAV
jgi:hypothetical protein